MNREVQRILNTSNYYEVLGIESNSDENVIKKAYRKLVSQVHPDKCKDPKATEAFQKLSHAYQILINPEKRKEYDLSMKNPRESSYNWDSDTTGYEVYEMSLDELLKFIFGNNINSWDDIYQKPQPKPEPKITIKWWKVAAVVLFFIFFIFPLLSSIFTEKYNVAILAIQLSDDDNIKFSKSTHDYQEIKSDRFKQTYYIRKSWLDQQPDRDIPEFRRALSKAADRIFENNLRFKCQQEMAIRKNGPSCAKARNLHIHVE